MTELDDLYQEVILDHNRSPRNFREMIGATHQAQGFNPLCGDRVTLYVRLDNGKIGDISFHGSGCAISKASASLLTQTVKGIDVAGAASLFGAFRRMVTEGISDGEALGKLAVFAGVRKFPSRVKCATLAWHTLHNALLRDLAVATTE